MKRNRPTVEEMDAALAAFHAGRPEVLDRLLGDDESGGSGVCAMLFELRRSRWKREERNDGTWSAEKATQPFDVSPHSFIVSR